MFQTVFLNVIYYYYLAIIGYFIDGDRATLGDLGISMILINCQISVDLIILPIYC